jgi:3'-phosphoadenosine 5'-phosphosulfate (PAPS) 3'-phosphatase
MARGADPLSSEFAAALAAVRAASELCRGAQGRLPAGHTLTKGDESPVTIADFAAQAVVATDGRFHDRVIEAVRSVLA